MKLVVNTNILFSFFRENPVREIIVNYDLFLLDLYTPAYALSELRANKPEVMRYAGISSEDFEFTLSSLESFIKVQPTGFFKGFKSEAKKVQ